jgi:hypothetical protein
MADMDALSRRALRLRSLAQCSACIAVVVCTTLLFASGILTGIISIVDTRVNMPTRMHSTAMHDSETASVRRELSLPHDRNKSTSGSSRMYVLTLDGVPGAHSSNTGRLRRMREAWAASCPEDSISFEVCLGVTHPIRGHGVVSAMTQCIDRAIRDGVDDAFFFEDDARLESNATELCQQRSRDNFVRNAPDDALLVFIGAHTQVPSKMTGACPLTQTWVSPRQLAFSFRPLFQSYGM